MEKKKNTGVENWKKAHNTPNQIISVFFKIIFTLCKALIQINTQLAQLLTSMPELSAVEEWARQKNPPHSSGISVFPNANHLPLQPHPHFSGFFF